MVSRLSVLLLLVSFLVSACGRGGGGSSGGGAIVGAEPTTLVRGRQMTLTVIGDGTNWTGIDLNDIEIRTRDGEVDPSIAVVSVNAANDQYLEISLDIAVDSLRDIRDLRVGKDRLDGVLHVEPPFEIVDATIVAPGHFFRLALLGRQTNWVPGTVTIEGSIPEVQFEGVRVSPDAGDPGFEPDIVTSFGVEVLTSEFLYVSGYVEFFAPPGPLDLTIHAGGVDDVFQAALEVAPLELTDLVPGTPVATTLEQPFETHVYRAALPINSTCSLSPLYFDDGTQEIALEVYNPADPLSGGYDHWAYYSYSSAIVWDPQDLIVIVHDLRFGGGVEYTYGLDYNCVDLAPATLTKDTPVAGEEIAAANEYNSYSMTMSPWTYTEVEVEATGALAVSEVYLYRSGPLDVAPGYLYESDFDDAFTSVRALSGIRNRAIAQVGDDNGEIGPDSAYTITWRETALAGTTIVSAVPAQSIPDAVVSGDMQSYVDSTIAVGAGALPGDLHIAVDIQHPYGGDLYLDLLSPLGKKVRLVSGASGVDVLEVYGLDVASSPDPPGVPFGDDTFLAEAAPDASYTDLLDLQDESPVGTWTLRVYDTYPFDSGVLQGWALAIE